MAPVGVAQLKAESPSRIQGAFSVQLVPIEIVSNRLQPLDAEIVAR